MTSYYRKFIQDYAKVAKPLINLTRGKIANANQSVFQSNSMREPCRILTN